MPLKRGPGPPSFALRRIFYAAGDGNGSSTRRYGTRFHPGFDRRPDPLPRLDRREMGGALLASQGFHPGLHDRARRGGEAQAGIRQTRRQGDRPQRRSLGLASRLVARHRRDARAGAEFPAPRRCRPQGVGPLRHDPSERTRHADRALGLHHRSNKKIRLILTYPASTGRNFAEILRTIDSLQLTDGYKVATPVNWEHGDDVIIAPSITDP